MRQPKAERRPICGKVGSQMRIEQAEARTEQAESRTEQAKTRAELAETRTEQAESRTERAKTRTEQAETRTEQAETALERVVQNDSGLCRGTSAMRLIKNITEDGMARRRRLLEPLTERQCEILKLIAEGRNTKSIGDILKVSPKTVEYHRLKLMDRLKLHDIPGLVRFALRVGLVPEERPLPA